MNILFVGETWRGSSARSMREAIAALPGINVEEIGEDHYFPRVRSPLLRLASRVLNRWHRAELARDVVDNIATRCPDVLMVYKGPGVAANLVLNARSKSVFTVNLYPDMSPHAHGKQLATAIGAYDLVVSTKPFHPASWSSVYGYTNPCVCVPHGYDPVVHYWAVAPTNQSIDIALAATCRREYAQLITDLAAALGEFKVRVEVAGYGWEEMQRAWPDNWKCVGALRGVAYADFVRRAKIVIAPVSSSTVVNGFHQPGDEDTTRTYELAAAGCFFLHRRTPYARQVYDEETEVPMWGDAAELAALVRRYLPDDAARRAMAARAHARAVPAYSIPSRAEAVIAHVKAALSARNP